jgi:hypothetical protein
LNHRDNKQDNGPPASYELIRRDITACIANPTAKNCDLRFYRKLRELLSLLSAEARKFGAAQASTKKFMRWYKQQHKHDVAIDHGHGSGGYYCIGKDVRK